MPGCNFKLPVFYYHRIKHLPYIIIDTFGVAIPDEPKILGNMRIFDHHSLSGFLSLFSHDHRVFNGRIGIEKRGQSSQNFPKKSYGIETRDATDQDLSVSLLRLPPESDWVLHGPYTDKSLLRNFLAYDLSNKIGRYASRTRFVEVYVKETGSPSITQQYMGVYLLAEKIKRDDQRVAITRLDVSQNAEPEVTGGYILKIDKDDPGDLTFTTALGTRLIHVYPKAGDITAQQQTWIQNYMNLFEQALNGADFEHYDLGYRNYIDIPSFVDYFLINEALRNIDAFRISTFLYKDRSKRLVMGPVWDFDISMGNADYYNGWKTDGWVIGSIPANDNYQQPFWWQRLLQSGIFVHSLIDRWFCLRKEQLNLANIFATIDNTIGSFRGAQNCNFEKWPILGQDVWPNYYYPATYGEEIENLKSWLEGRFRWIDESIYFLMP